MADMMNTLKALLGDNADAKIQNAMTMLQNSGLLNQADSGVKQSPPQAAENVKSPAAAQNVPVQNTENEVQKPQPSGGNITAAENSAPSFLTPEGMQFVGQIRSMVEQMSNTNDSRSNLLRSLRPFMRSDRQRSIDRAVRLMNIGRFSGLFGR